MANGNPFAVQPITGFTPGFNPAASTPRSPYSYAPPMPPQNMGGGFGGFARTALQGLGGPAGLAAGALGGLGNYLQGRRNMQNQRALMEQQRQMGQRNFELYDLPAAHQQGQQYAGQQAFRHGLIGNWLPGGGGEGSFGPLRAAAGDPFQYRNTAQLRALNPYNVPTPELRGPSLFGSILGGIFG